MLLLFSYFCFEKQRYLKYYNFTILSRLATTNLILSFSFYSPCSTHVSKSKQMQIKHMHILALYKSYATIGCFYPINACLKVITGVNYCKTARTQDFSWGGGVEVHIYINPNFCTLLLHYIQLHCRNKYAKGV